MWSEQNEETETLQQMIDTTQKLEGNVREERTMLILRLLSQTEKKKRMLEKKILDSD